MTREISIKAPYANSEGAFQQLISDSGLSFEDFDQHIWYGCHKYTLSNSNKEVLFTKVRDELFNKAVLMHKNGQIYGCEISK